MRDDGVTPGRRGRFDGFDVLAESSHWDPVTRERVLARMDAVPNLEFFDAVEASTARALCDRLVAQDDEPRVPVVELIDQRLCRREGDGYRYADMPEDGVAWKRSLAGLDHDAHIRAGHRFDTLTTANQRDLLEAINLEDGLWHGMPARRVFELWMRYVTTAFYSHPWAWNEIGFPGPAYPRGYKAFAVGQLEPFEVHERDPRDPLPWLHKVEEAKRRHAEGMQARSDR